MYSDRESFRPVSLSFNLQVIVSASPSSSASASTVAWFRDSFGLPLGLPLCPARTGAPAVLPLYFQRAQSHPRHYLLIWRTTTQPGRDDVSAVNRGLIAKSFEGPK